MRIYLMTALLGLTLCLLDTQSTTAQSGSSTRNGSDSRGGSSTRSGSDKREGSDSRSGSATGNGSDSRGGSDSRSGSGARGNNSSRNRGGFNGDPKHAQTRRLREGTVIKDASGFFREDGDGASFVSDLGIEFGTLPNLNLERVVRLLKGADAPNSIRWSVTGTVTEYSGKNYLLLKRAVYKSSTSPPAPDRVATP